MGALAVEWTIGDKLSAWGLVIGSLGVVISAVGFGLAWIQLRRTATATEATEDAVKKTEQAVRESNRLNLLLLLPQFRMLELHLDFAIRADSRDLVDYVLVSYRHYATDVAASIEANGDADRVAVQALWDSAKEAMLTKDDLYSDKTGASLRDLTAAFRNTMTQVAGELARYRSVLDGTPHGGTI